MPSDATDDDIRKQYRKLAVLIHPDKVLPHAVDVQVKICEEFHGKYHKSVNNSRG